MSVRPPVTSRHGRLESGRLYGTPNGLCLDVIRHWPVTTYGTVNLATSRKEVRKADYTQNSRRICARTKRSCCTVATWVPVIFWFDCMTFYLKWNLKKRIIGIRTVEQSVGRTGRTAGYQPTNRRGVKGSMGHGSVPVTHWHTINLILSLGLGLSNSKNNINNFPLLDLHILLW